MDSCRGLRAAAPFKSFFLLVPFPEKQMIINRLMARPQLLRMGCRSLPHELCFDGLRDNPGLEAPVEQGLNSLAPLFTIIESPIVDVH